MSFLDQIAPVLLTYNEEPNIGRSLAQLSWARDILVVDSYSTDGTLAVCGQFANVRVLQRRFDCHANQWNFAVEQAQSRLPWILALDADHILTDAFRDEVAQLAPSEDVAGYWCQFRYVVFGRILRSGVYPAKPALFSRARGRYVQDGHTQREVIDGWLGTLVAPILHDDRKPLQRWVQSQGEYARLESEKLIAQIAGNGRIRAKDWLRARTPFAPLAMAAICLIVRGGMFEGVAGWFYALQRAIAEALISIAVMDAQFNSRERNR